MLDFKPGCSIRRLQTPMLVALMIADQLYQVFGSPCIVTSGDDGTHKVGSLHYAGLAVDLRTHHLSSVGTKAHLVTRLSAKLGPLGFEVLLEGEGTDTEHLHIEFDPEHSNY